MFCQKTGRLALLSILADVYKRQALINVQRNYSILEGVVYGFATAAGFFIAIVLMAGIREKIEDNDIPESFKGTPIVLLTACLMAIAFFGFSGLK